MDREQKTAWIVLGFIACLIVGGFAAALLYGLLTVLWYERFTMVTIPLQTLETILTRQAGAASFSLLVIRYSAILVLYQNRNAE